MLKINFFVTLVLLALSLISAVTCKLEPLKPIESYTHHLVVTEGNPEQLQVFWKIIKDEIQFEVHCKTTGWVGLGISPNGNMVGSDMAIGWVLKGKPYLLDAFATGLSRPAIDKVQNWKLLEGAEISGYTILKFKRKLLTCDKVYDKEITSGTNNLIFAWNNQDPTKDAKDSFLYHGMNRFSNATVVLNYREESLIAASTLPEDTFSRDFFMKHINIPEKQTHYQCNLIQSEFDNPVHLIKVEAFLKQKDNVRSISLYECDDDYEPSLPLLNKECGPSSLPGDVAIKCESKLVFVWKLGGAESYDFPKKVGYKFEASNKKFFLLKTQYENRIKEKDLIDNSGLTLYFTKKMRNFDAGLMVLGVDDSALSIQIPPGTNQMTVSSTCYPECTQKFFPNDGIYVFSALTTMNGNGVSLKTSIARDGKILSDLFVDQQFNSNHQFLVDIVPSKVMKGDSLITKCTYNTRTKGRFIYRGYSSFDNENCVSYIYYYPRLPDLFACASNLQPKSIYDFYRSLMSENLIPKKTLDDKQYFQNMNEITGFFQNEVTMSDKLRDRFVEFFSSKYNETYFCGNSNDLKNSLYVESISRYQPKELVEVKKCSSTSIFLQKSAFLQLAFTLFSVILVQA